MHFLGHLHISSNSGLRNHGSWSAKKEGRGTPSCKALKRGCVAGLLAGCTLTTCSWGYLQLCATTHLGGALQGSAKSPSSGQGMASGWFHATAAGDSTYSVYQETRRCLPFPRSTELRWAGDGRNGWSARSPGRQLIRSVSEVRYLAFPPSHPSAPRCIYSGGRR